MESKNVIQLTTLILAVGLLFTLVIIPFGQVENDYSKKKIDMLGPYSIETQYFNKCLLYEKAKVEAFTFNKLKEGYYEKNCFKR